MLEYFTEMSEPHHGQLIYENFGPVFDTIIKVLLVC